MRKNIFLFLVVLFIGFGNLPLFSQGFSSDSDDFISAFSESNLLENISFVFDFCYLWRNLEDGEYKELDAPGMIDSADYDARTNDKLGFNLNYAELAIPARIDKLFTFFLDMHIDTEELNLHEIYVASTDLPAGLHVKFGRFLSHFGRLNSQHGHYQDFYDKPILLQTMFGNDGLLENGVGFTWQVPVDFFFTLGVEVMQGENDTSYGNEAIELSTISMPNVTAAKWPNVYNFLIKNGFRTDSLDVFWGISVGSGGARITKNWSGNTGWAMDGDTFMLGVDLMVKYNFDAFHYVSLQCEYIQRTVEGTKYYGESSPATVYTGISKKNSGFYTQLIGRPFVNWRIGARFEMMLKNQEEGTDLAESTHEMMDCFKASSMIDYTPTQNTRFRLQYNYNSYQYDGVNALIVNHEAFVQATMSIGKHGRFFTE